MTGKRPLVYVALLLPLLVAEKLYLNRQNNS